MHKVVLGAKSEEHLNKLAKKLENNNIDFKDCFVNSFREQTGNDDSKESSSQLWMEQPENYPTALALRPYPKDDVKKLFKGAQAFSKF